MSLLFTDGFDCYGTGDISSIISCKWGVGPSSGVTGVAGKEQGNAIALSSVVLISPRFSDAVTLIIGFWFKRSVVGAIDKICGFRFDGIDYVDVRINGSDQLFATRAGTTLGTGTTTISADTWYFVELKSLIDNSAGTIDVNLNGQSEISLSGQDTQEGTSAFVNEVIISGDASVALTYDHLYCCNTSGTRLNDFLGPIEIESIKPDGVGNSSAWTPLSGSNFDNVNELAPDGDTTYNSTSAANKDTHAFADIVHNGVNLALANNVLSRKDNIGAATYRNITRTGNADFDGTTVTAYDDYTYNVEIEELNPDISVVWSKSDIDSSEFGYERVS